MGFEEFRFTVLTVLSEKGTTKDAELQEAVAGRGIRVPTSPFTVGMLALIKTGLVGSVRVGSTGNAAPQERIYWISDAGKTLLVSLRKTE